MTTSRSKPDTPHGLPDGYTEKEIARSQANLERLLGPEIIAELSGDEDAWTLDTVLRRSPHAKPLSDEEILRTIKVLRAERAMIEAKSEARRAKKQGVEESEDDKESDSN